MTGLDASNIATGTLNSARLPVPLTVNGTTGGWVILGQNNAALDGSTGTYSVSTGATGSTNGIIAVSQSNAGTGAWGWASNPSGTTYGVLGLSNSTAGTGVLGRSNANSGTTYGVHGSTDSGSGTGVYGQGATGVLGKTTATSGLAYAGRFETASTGGVGVFGFATANSGTTYGGYFQAQSNAGRAVFGWATASSGQAYGGNFQSESNSGRGVYGVATSSTGTTYGVYGASTSPDGRGVFGNVNAGFGSGNGVRGENNSPDGRGVLGYASATNGLNYGGRFQSDSPSGYGLYCVGSFGASGSKAFRIDHPSDPENKYLLHYSTESPVPQNFYVGNVVTDSSGYAWVELPEYFQEINTNFKYQLTVISDGKEFVQTMVSQKIQGRRFQVRTSAPNTEVSWRVDADRNDLYIRNRRPMDVVEKEGLERGKYQHPELYGKGPEQGMEYIPRQVVKGETNGRRP